MSHAEICPVCKGKGTKVKAIEGSIKTENVSCHGCGGLGWVTVGVDYSIHYPSHPICPRPIYPPYEPHITYGYNTPDMRETETPK